MLSVLADQVDVLVVGGGMCFTFLAALGHDVGASVVDLDHLDRCRGLLDAGVRIVLPDDVLALAPGGVLDHEGGTGEVRRFGCDLPEGWRGLDIGPHSIEAFAHVIAEAGSVLWNGPMGVFEDPRFAGGTRGVAQAVADCAGFSVVGGGDTTAAVRRYGLDSWIDHLSTGGGATLELIEKGDLPGLAALRASSWPSEKTG